MVNKLKTRGFGLIGIFSIFIVLGLAATAGWFVYKKQADTSKNSTDNSTFKTKFGEKLIRSNCDNAKSLIKVDVLGDNCYIGKFLVDDELISYINVDQSEKYQEKQAKNCTMDCGGSLYMPGPDYIVRANGVVEKASTDWTNPADDYIGDLTGCGSGKFFRFEPIKNNGKIVKDNGKFAVAVTLDNFLMADEYGNKCYLDIKILSYTSITSNRLNIQKISVNYQLNSVEGCTKQSKPEDCYTAQAVMRDDIQLCKLAVDRQYPQRSDDYCVANVAIRRMDISLCDQVNEPKDYCRKTIEDLKSVFTGQVVTK